MVNNLLNDFINADVRDVENIKELQHRAFNILNLEIERKALNELIEKNKGNLLSEIIISQSRRVDLLVDKVQNRFKKGEYENEGK